MSAKGEEALLVTDIKQLETIFASSSILACDVETAKDKWLLGVSISDGKCSTFTPIYMHTNGEFVLSISPSDSQAFSKLLQSKQLIGHNFTYDKRFIDNFFCIQTIWVADTRIMWHLSAAPAGPRPYSLKDAQVELLGWKETNEGKLKQEVEEKGGKLSKGDHYLASIQTLSEYASEDSKSTFHLYTKLSPFFNKYDYWWMLEKMMCYSQLLARNTEEGIKVNVDGLMFTHQRYLRQKKTYEKAFRKHLKVEINELEKDWADRKMALYKREANKIRYASHTEEWERFNLNSDKHKRELFFDKLKLPVIETTEGGRPRTSSDVAKSLLSITQGFGSFDSRVSNALQSYLKYEHVNTISSNFSGPHIKALKDGRIHPGFNVCGTVSYRLSGFKPYFLNAPFSETKLLENYRVDDGFVGLHADLSAIEPTITAAYSEDLALMKVFGEGKGDIYLDLALGLFPNDKELREGYDSNVPLTKKVKERFVRQRNIAKIIQLAVQYTGTKFTVAKNLTKAGFPTTIEQADVYVKAYWRKFAKVAQWEKRLRKLNRQQGHLRNAIGRLIQVPDPEYKDLSNRFIQSSGHDCLILWVLEIYRLSQYRSLDIKPVLLDVHDSTSNMCPRNQIEALEKVYVEALANVNEQLGLPVKIKVEMKRFQTLAGLKGNENG